MKRFFLTTAAVMALGAMSITASAAVDEPDRFSNVTSNWGNAYTTYFYSSNGGITFRSGNVTANPLPYGLMDHGMVYSICCYNGRLYYSTGPEGSDIGEPVKIYSSGMDGTDNQLIADNAEAWSDIYIVDNVLYYTGYSSSYGYAKGYDGGIYKINLADKSWSKIVTGDVHMRYCDGDYVYYTDFGNVFAAIDVNGYQVVNMPSEADEFNYDLSIKGNHVYYVSGTAIYTRARGGGSIRKICNVPENSQINSITENYIYYSVLDFGYYGSTATLNCVTRW